ncbi:hypothetical protein ABIE85_007106 [Bradyrhizobium diazoefficiens]|jgi:hypothetical protein|uniref:Uncharacterized protein n=1 Tax=Bradyrhizobium diazoefficiens TaxID=1355477 RepID=A0A809XKF3_9BRAD|nr:hypothetical protein [Bradyrhizobium diazoefficiens]MBP1060184.1 hypothetical protein [Bradyrhizobium japonicum]AWO88234.1 hypothetical protein DI395_06450 [Bradyrhizobium diazoefficiens]WLA57461.1 hypothetical protein QIH81_01560 [Bradyrhizobium diazoefficiens]BCA00292.1 hypothetical protein H12S4_11960 [Bradyrhizobium diazoefficiens]BCA17976.1 hypothetical protein BDHH15_11910 [Bradyrhizobium diazoefficiens]
MFSIFDASGSRVRRDITADELNSLQEAEKEVAPRYIAAALDAEEATDELHEAERKLRRLQALEDAAITASQSDPVQDRIDALKAVIAANQ